MTRRFVLPLACVLAACAAPAPVAPPVVHLAASPEGHFEAAPGTMLAECRITGDGERSRPWGEGRPSFDVFRSRRARAPSLEIVGTSAVHVSWSAFPAAPGRDARARVELGGQRHVRFVGWTPLEGRLFTTERRMYARPHRVWARAGAPIAITSAVGGVATAVVRTPFSSPETFVVRGGCDAVAYESNPPEIVPREPRAVPKVLTRGPLDLHDAPSGAAFATIALAPNAVATVAILERRSGFARVTAEIENVGFDAWVPESEVKGEHVWGGRGYGYGSSHCGGITISARSGVVARDSQLFVGTEPEALGGAVVERDAMIYYRPSEAKTVNGVDVVPFEFQDRWLGAPSGSSFWVAKDAVLAPK